MPNRTKLNSSSERQITFSRDAHVLTNANVFSPDSQWIVYDIRSNGGDTFDGQRIERVNVETGEVRVEHRATRSANVGVATFDPASDRIVFIEGPRNPSPEFPYGFSRRHGLVVDVATHREDILDARDLTPPFTRGALRGGTHVHIFSADGEMVSSTYEDDCLERLGTTGSHERNHRTIAVSQLGRPTVVSKGHPFNHDGIAFTAVVTATTDQPNPGSDEISRAVEDAWIGNAGYVRSDGRRQRRALAFQGFVTLADGRVIREVFVVDLPDDLSTAVYPEVAEAATRRLRPPESCVQRRITFTQDRTYPGLGGPRHWLRSSPDGSQIAFLASDDDGIAQLWTVSPNGGPPRAVTRNPVPIGSSFTWSPDGKYLAHLFDECVAVTCVERGTTLRLTDREARLLPPRSQGCIFSADGQKIAFVRPIPACDEVIDQICVVDFQQPLA